MESKQKELRINAHRRSALKLVRIMKGTYFQMSTVFLFILIYSVITLVLCIDLYIEICGACVVEIGGIG